MTDVTPAMALWGDETFGPVAAVYLVDGDEDAIARANDSAHGLTARVVTRQRTRRARRAPAGRRLGEHQRGLRRRLGFDRQPQQWLEGLGPGHRHGRHAFDVVTRTKTIAIQRLMPLAVHEASRQRPTGAS